MTEINAPVSPEELNPAPHPALAGNYADDDGEAIDEWFEAADVGPQDYGTVPVNVAPVIKVPPTRIISRTIAVNQSSDPVMLFSADVHRKDLIVRISSDAVPVDTVYTLIGSDKTDVYNQAFFNAGPASEFRTDKHTGAVWFYARLNPTTVETEFTLTVNAWSVTE